MKLDSRRWTLLLAIGLILAALVIFLISAATPPAVTVEWSTASELNTAGFNILRGESESGPFTRLNPKSFPPRPIRSSAAATSTPTPTSRPARPTTINWKKSNSAAAPRRRARWSSPLRAGSSRSSSSPPSASPSSSSPCCCGPSVRAVLHLNHDTDDHGAHHRPTARDHRRE